MAQSLDVQVAIRRLERTEGEINPEGRASSDWWKTVASVLDAFAARPIPESLLHLSTPVGWMVDGWEKTNASEEPDKPHKVLLRGVRELFVVQPFEWKRLETIDELYAEKIDPEQIARMHGLSLAQVEQIHAGKLEYPKNHSTPHDVAHANKRRKCRGQFMLAMATWKVLRDRDDKDVVGASKTALDMLADGATNAEVAARFTPEELAEQGLDAATIAEITQVDPEDVVDAMDEKGFGVETVDFDKMTLEDQVIALHEGGVDNAEIHDATGAPLQRITAIIRKHDDRKAAENRRKGAGLKDKIKRANAAAKAGAAEPVESDA